MWCFVLIGVPFVAMALSCALRAWRRLQGIRRASGVLGATRVALGGFAFFSSALAAMGAVHLSGLARRGANGGAQPGAARDGRPREP